MFLRTKEVTAISRRWNNSYQKLVDVYSCDECGQEFDKQHSSIPNDHLTFCSRECNQKTRSTGVLSKLWKEIKLEKYGVEYSAQVSGAKEKMLQTRELKFGTVAPVHYHDGISQKWKNTMQEKYGVDHPSQNEDIKLKKKETNLSRYGVTCPFSSGSIFRDEDACVRGGQAGYRALILKTGLDLVSNPERIVGLFLFDFFGKENIQQQIKINHDGKKPWLIDFYISSIDIYLEVDGEFWHGLDVEYDQLHPKQQVTYDRDRQQDKWFKKHQMKLVRITDKEVLDCQEKCNWNLLISRLGG